MYRVLCLLLLASLNLAKSYTQNLSQKWRAISEAEFELKVYDKDPEAVALILFDKGDSYFEKTQEGYEVIFERIKRAKILRKNGLQYADISIPILPMALVRPQK